MRMRWRTPRSWPSAASAFPSVYGAYPTVNSPYPSHDARDQIHAACAHAHDSIASTAYHALARGVPIRIPTHGFQSHAFKFFTSPNPLPRGLPLHVSSLCPPCSRRTACHFAHPSFLGDFAGFHRLLNTFAHFVKLRAYDLPRKRKALNRGKNRQTI